LSQVVFKTFLKSLREYSLPYQ